jgi:hypothetical protein
VATLPGIAGPVFVGVRYSKASLFVTHLQFGLAYFHRLSNARERKFTRFLPVLCPITAFQRASGKWSEPARPYCQRPALTMRPSRRMEKQLRTQTFATTARSIAFNFLPIRDACSPRKRPAGS